MNALAQLLKDNADSSNTHYDILTGEQVCAIVEALNCEFIIDRMREVYEEAI